MILKSDVKLKEKLICYFKNESNLVTQALKSLKN